jgi:glycosyltransferase involved in cell wall biosynthesis
VYRGKKIGVAVPAYNEEKLIGETLKGIPEYVDRIYVCNDGSTDRTAEIVKVFMEKDRRIFLINHEKNMGVGKSIIDCYKKGLEESMDIMVVMAGDNQMDPSEMPKLLDPIIEGRADYTKGNRLYSRDALRGMSAWRTFGNAILTILTKIASGYWHVSDPQNGYTAISRKSLSVLPLDDVYPWYGYCNDLLVKMNVYGLRVLDVPIPARYGNEKSKIKYGKYILRVSWLLLRDFLWRLKVKYVVRSFHPLIFFYLAGIILASLGIFGVIWSLAMKILAGERLFERLVISLITFGIGAQSLFFAMYFDMEENRRIMESWGE